MRNWLLRRRLPASAAATNRPPVEDDENPSELGDEDEQPAPTRRRRLKKKTKSNTPLIVGAAAGATLLIAAVILGVMFWPSGKKTDPVAANTPTRSAPGAGGSAVPGGGSGGSSLGRQVFEANCMRCHATGGGAGGGRGRNRGPDLARVGQDPTHTVEWLMAFIRDPESRKPGARMPGFFATLPKAARFFADNIYVPGEGGELLPGVEDTWKRRGEHVVLKNYFSEDDLRAFGFTDVRLASWIWRATSQG